MDIHMPVMNGYEATGLIKNMDSSIPIIAMTADAIAGVEEKCSSVGIDHYINKPFDPEQFVEKVWQVVKPYKEGLLIKAEDEAKQEESVKANQVLLDEKNGIRHMGGKKDLYDMVLKEYYNENKETSLILNRAIEKEDYGEVEVIPKLHKEFEEILKRLLLVLAQRIKP